MLISRNWLSDFVSLDVSTEEIAEKLTALGLEVESIHKAAPAFTGVVVGRVLALEKHPDADKLRVATVDIAAEEPLQIVCGAPNVAEGMTVAVATVGAKLPGDFKIKKSKLRGVESFGMLCSESELGLADNSSGLMTLPEQLTLGQDIRDALVLDDDIIEIGVTPNRGDCLSIKGVARELAVGFERFCQPNDIQETPATGSSPTVELQAPAACPHYFARTISGIDNTCTSPIWLVERLRRAGIRSLSPVVDITNYVMIALGTPMHAFSASAIGEGIVVRHAHEKEQLTLLDGKEITLDSDMLVIANKEKAVALAGIMGGANSVIHHDTTEIVLESAWFSPEAIVGRARRIGLHTDASYRFERGVDFTLQEMALEMASQLIIDICGGHAHKKTIATDPSHLPSRDAVALSAKQVDDVLGIAFPRERIAQLLTQLGMDVSADEHREQFSVTPPSYRFDITIAEDLIEELIRVWGYERIETIPVRFAQIAHQPKAKDNVRRKVNQALVDLGYNEAISYSFIDEKMAQLLSDTRHQVPLVNPLSAELAVMRTSLLPSLLKALQYNLNRQQQSVRLYEFGNTYQRIDGEIIHSERLCAVLTGNGYPLQWGVRQRYIDFYDVKGELETLFELLGVLENIRYVRSERDYLHPGQSADIYYGDTCIGFVGGLHPVVEKKLDFETKVFAFEIDIAKIIAPKLPTVRALPKYPEVRRDISLIVKQGHQVSDILEAIQSVDSDIVTDVRLFDVYIGRNIPKNTKSIAIAIFLQDITQTLTDERADSVVTEITTMLVNDFNAELRG